MMRFIDFFSGIGGFRKGMEEAGHKCVGFCELDKFAVASYTSMHLITEEQRKYLETLPLNKRRTEILKEEYRNGEWFSNDISKLKAEEIPEAECWCAGFPCTNISVAGTQEGLKGSASGLFYEITRLLEEQKEEDRPEWLFLENVKNLLSIHDGWDFATVLLEMDRCGYDIQWRLLNSRDFGVPQNRERVFIIGHLRKYGSAKVLSFEGTDGKDSVYKIEQVGMDGASKRKNPNQYRVYNPEGLSPTLNMMEGGGREPHIINIVDNNMFCKDEKSVAIPVITPDRAKKRQNGRRFKENGDPAFTLTAQDRHGVAISIDAMGVIDDQGRLSKRCKVNDVVPTLRRETHGNLPKILQRVDAE